MAFTYNTTTNVGKVRLLINDKINTPSHNAQFSDGELQIFLTMESEVVMVASALALEAWVAAITDSLTAEHIGDYSYSKKEIDNKLTLAKQYRKVGDETPYLDWAEMDLTGEEDDE